MEQKSCLISNPAVFSSSKQVLIFAERTAKECNLLASDLILAAVWHCFNQTKQTYTDTYTDNDKTCVENNTHHESVIDDDEKRLQNEDNRTRSKQCISSLLDEESAGNSFDSAKTKIGTYEHRPHTGSKEEKHHSSQDSDVTKTEKNVNGGFNVEPNIEIDSNRSKKHNTQVAKHSESAPVSQVKAFISELNNEKIYPVSSHENTDDLKEKKFGSKTIDTPKLAIAESEPNLCNLSDKNVKANSQTHSKEINMQVRSLIKGNKECVTEQSSVHAVHNTTPGTSFVKGVIGSDKKIVERKSHQAIAADVEIISIDDEDSNDAYGGSTEETVTPIETVTNDEIEEEKEPDYFDMDCDEIDDSVEYEEMFYTDTTVKEESPKRQIAEDTCVKNNASAKDADITIISDDDNDHDDDNEQNAKSTSDLQLKKESNSSGKSGVVKSQATPSRRKQAHTNIKEDFSENIDRKAKEKVVMDRMIEGVSTAFTCPVIQHMEDMTTSIQESSPKQTDVKKSLGSTGVDNNASQETNTAAMLGLTPVGTVTQKLTDNMVPKAEPKAVQIVPSLVSNQSIYVSSGLVHGCIPSLPPLRDLHSADPTSSPEPSHYTPDSQMQSALYIPPQVAPIQSLHSDLKSPPRKKRLLDYDKKWHMEPKYSPEQDKYLALPGGVEGNSVLTGWRQPGKYASISEVFSSPEIGIETVDSDYMNYKSLDVGGYLDDEDDNDFEVSDDGDDDGDDDGNDDASDSSDEVCQRKRGVKGVTRGRGRGRPRIHRIRGTSRGTRGTGKRIRSTGRGLTRGPKPLGHRGGRRGSVRGVRGRPRTRPLLRGSVGTRRGPRTRGSSNKLFNLKNTQGDVSPSKFGSFNLRAGFTSRGRKIGFYSLRLGQAKKASEGAVKRGSHGVVRRGRGRPKKRALHSDLNMTTSSVDRDVPSASSSASQPRKRGRPSLRHSHGIVRRGRAASTASQDKHKHIKEEKDGDVIIID